MGPFVKWAGGKTQLLDALRDNMPESFNTYYEPFVGAGAFLLSLTPDIAIINDINEELINVYLKLKDNTQELIDLIESFDKEICNKEYYLAKRDCYNQKITHHILDIETAALMIWLNKHCFNGLYRVNSKGLFNVPYNNRKAGSSIDPNNLKAIGEYLNKAKVKILAGDFAKACESAKKDDFVYFDFPYIPQSDTANFTDYTKTGFSYEEHLRLSVLFKELSAKGVKLMLSNNDVPLVHELYQGFNIKSLEVRRNINRNANNRKGQEVIITNY